ncbi:MAG: DUF167 domain-containing protein [Candidatus Thorarchaeota archaeon]
MSRHAVWENDEGTFLRVTARPRSKRREIVLDLDDESLVVNLTSPAREGKANTELLRLLAKLLKVSAGKLKLVRGRKSREKTILAEGLTAESVVRLLREVTNDK